MKIKLTKHVTVDAKSGLAQWSEWDVQILRVMTDSGKMVSIRPDECVVLGHATTDIDVARLEFVIAAFNELIMKWGADVQQLHEKMES